jgi:hypothetical protein
MWLNQAWNELMSPVEVEHKMTASEWAEGVVGVRRLTDVPLFNVPYMFEALERGDKGSLGQAFQRWAGDISRSFFVPGRALNDFIGGAGELVAENFGDPAGIDEDTLDSITRRTGQALADHSLTMKETTEDEFFSSMIGDIPGIRSVVPNRVDPFTGEYLRTKGPLLRQLAVTTREHTPWEVTMGSVNATSFDMIGKWRSRSAKMLISEEIGKMLQTKGPDGQTLSQRLSAQVDAIGKGKPIEIKQQAVTKINGELREAATVKAAARAPKLFAKEMLVKQSPIFVRENIKELLEGN